MSNLHNVVHSSHFAPIGSSDDAPTLSLPGNDSLSLSFLGGSNVHPLYVSPFGTTGTYLKEWANVQHSEAIVYWVPNTHGGPGSNMLPPVPLGSSAIGGALSIGASCGAALLAWGATRGAAPVALAFAGCAAALMNNPDGLALINKAIDDTFGLFTPKDDSFIAASLSNLGQSLDPQSGQSSVSFTDSFGAVYNGTGSGDWGDGATVTDTGAVGDGGASFFRIDDLLPAITHH